MEPDSVRPSERPTGGGTGGTVRNDLLRDLRKRVSRIMAEGPKSAPAKPATALPPEPDAPAGPREDVWEAPQVFPRGEGTSHAELLGGREVAVSDDAEDRFWHSEFLLAESWPQAAERLARLGELLAGGDERVPEDLRPAFAAGAGGLVFLDIETAGLRGEPAFLVGCLTLPAEGPTFAFYLARDFPEEPVMLGALNEWWSGFPCIVTFNGKSFDVPYLRDRMRMWRVRPAPPAAHLDLLHMSRRRYRGDVPNCRLQTLERAILGRARSDDLPSAEIPRVFVDYVETGDAGLLVPIIQHNALDLVTLAELLLRQVETL